MAQPGLPDGGVTSNPGFDGAVVGSKGERAGEMASEIPTMLLPQNRFPGRASW
jgi:hypothetical protein